MGDPNPTPEPKGPTDGDREDREREDGRAGQNGDGRLLPNPIQGAQSSIWPTPNGKPRQPDQQEQTEALQEIRAILVEQSGELAEILDYIRLRAPQG